MWSRYATVHIYVCVYLVLWWWMVVVRYGLLIDKNAHSYDEQPSHKYHNLLKIFFNEI